MRVKLNELKAYRVKNESGLNYRDTPRPDRAGMFSMDSASDF